MGVEHVTTEMEAQSTMTALVRYLRTAPKDIVIDATPPGVSLSVTDLVRPPAQVFHGDVHGAGHRYQVLIDCGGRGENWADVYSPEFDSEFEGREPFELLKLLHGVPQPQMFQVLLRRILADARTVFFLSISYVNGELQQPPDGDLVWPWQ